MRHGIPPYRLARDVLDAEIARIVALGVDVRCGEPLATPRGLRAPARRARRRLRRHRRRARQAAAGARLRPAVGDGRRRLPGACERRPAAGAGAPVVVIGGGSAALDVARSARRAGHEVTILALESRAQMPAQREEVDEALEEGVALVDGAMLAAAHGQPAPGLRLDCVRVRFEPGAAGGQFSVVPLAEGSEFSSPPTPSSPRSARTRTSRRFDGALPARGALLAVDGRQATGSRRRLGRRRRGQHGALRHRGGRHGQARGARDRPPAARRGGATPAPRERRARRATEAVVPLATIATFYYPKAPRAAEHVRLPSERHRAARRCSSGSRSSRRSPKPSAASPAAPASSATTASSTAPTSRCKRVGGGYVVLDRLLQGLRPVREGSARPGR